MNNPFVVLWLVVDAVAIIALVRLLQAGTSARTSAMVMAALQLVALGAAVASATLSVVDAAPLIWATIVAVNLALAVAGLTVGIRVLSLIGLAGTAFAVGLLVLGSFASVMVAACSAVMLIGGALLPRGGSSSETRTAQGA